MATIKKKTWPECFELVQSGKKRIDLRVNDFDVKEGDILVLEEWDPKTNEYTGRRIEKEIDYVLKFDLNSFNQEEEIKDKGLLVIQFKK
jgi:hypothetical protein